MYYLRSVTTRHTHTCYTTHRKNVRKWVCSCRNPLQWKLPFYRTEWKRHTSYSFFFFLRQLPMVSVWPKFRPKANIWEAKAKKRGRNRDLPQSHRSGALSKIKTTTSFTRLGNCNKGKLISVCNKTFLTVQRNYLLVWVEHFVQLKCSSKCSSYFKIADATCTFAESVFACDGVEKGNGILICKIIVIASRIAYISWRW